MPMGLCDAPTTFQSLMNSIFGDLVDAFMVVHLEYLLIYSDSYDNHLTQLDLVLSRLADNELYVGKSKSEVMSTHTEFLGLQLGIEGISVGVERKNAVQNWPRPKNLWELRSFIGLLHFFRRFINGFSQLVSPLTNLTRKGSGIYKRNDEGTSAFDSLNNSLCNAPIMQTPNWELPFRYHVDASALPVGGTLTQLDL